MRKACKIDRVDHEIIEKQMLLSLSDKGKVALVLDVHGLNAVIAALGGILTPSKYQQQLLADLRLLHAAAFSGRC